jgi:hypothetical protein
MQENQSLIQLILYINLIFAVKKKLLKSNILSLDQNET